MKLLTILSLNGKNVKEKTEARGLKQYFERFSTVVTVVFQSQVLGPIDILSKKLQRKKTDIFNAASQLESLLEDLRSLRNNWDQTLETAVELAKSWGITPKFEEKRSGHVKKFFDELSRDSRLQSEEKRYEVQVFNCALDITIEQAEARFKSFKETHELFHCIDPNYIAEKSIEELLPLSKKLVSIYPDDISEELSDQLVLLKFTFSRDLAKIKSIKELAEFLLVEHSEVSSSFTEIITASILFLTLPVTVASAERSFSKLKLIKTYLRSTMSQSRLSALATLSVERDRVQRLDLDQIINDFAEKKTRKKDL